MSVTAQVARGGSRSHLAHSYVDRIDRCGVRMLTDTATPMGYASQLAKYIKDPSTLRVRVLERFTQAPTREECQALIEDRRAQRQAFLDKAAQFDWTKDDLEREAKLNTPPAPKAAPTPKPKHPPRKATKNARKHLNVRSPRQTTPDDVARRIIAEIAAALRVPLADLFSTSRMAHVSRCRRVCAWTLYQLGNSYPIVGKLLGGLDHSSIIHAVRFFDERATPNMREIAAHHLPNGATSRGGHDGQTQ